MRKESTILFLLPFFLGACAQLPPPTVSTGAAIATARSEAAQNTAQLAEERLAAITAQRHAAEQKFCPDWQESLGLVRRDAVGCVQGPGASQSTCWDAVSRWAAAKGDYYSALGRFFQGSPYAEPSLAAENFFRDTARWALTCRDSTENCLQAAQRFPMQAEKESVNRFCTSLPASH
ncbi:MAG: hypothetical protein JJ693_00685 [Acidithiobacillus sp.]|nr:hypothetical protein [Acidithiobacillus sp.]